MKHALRFASLLLISAVALSACGKGTSTATNAETTNNPSLDTAASPAPSAPSAAASPEDSSPSDAPATASSGQTYREKDGLFEIAFPEGYTYEETGSGIAFVSKDQGFGGSVDFGSSQGTELSDEQLEQALKKEYENRLKDIEWQETKPQPDGSIRVDWVGKDPSGNQLDAVSFVEQRGDNIFILNLFGVNKDYQDYNSDAEQIVSTYKVKQ
jgi:ABC-type phosphate transport system substrate-binding protein